MTCISAADCWAVGYFENYSVFQTLIQHWDGSSWSIIPSPNVSPTQEDRLTSVTCTSVSDCWAVGYYFAGNRYQTLILRWDGSAWTIVTSPNASASDHNVLDSVACASASNCWAVGNYSGAGPSQTLIEHWDGSAWTIVSSPNTSATEVNSLRGVTCASASNCWAVGNAGSRTLVERWDGISWNIVSSPNTSGSLLNSLAAVTCTSASDCWAVGSYGKLVGVTVSYQTLIEHWDGTSWTIVPSPNTLASGNYLFGVTCVSASDCWAVGRYRGRSLIQRWDGTSWNIVSSPNTSETDSNWLSGITCVSASDCRAVGFYSPVVNSIPQTLIERWDGTSWTIASSPNVFISKGNTLKSVACLAESNCWAVGYYLKDGTAYQTLIEHWDGSAWTIVSSPNTSTTEDNFLESVTCTSASNCWAAGYSLTGGNAYRALFEHWDGSSWTIVPSAGDVAGTLHSVTCTSASNCWAVGFVGAGVQGIGTTQTLIEHWDGSAWVVVPSPNGDPVGSNVLWGVACASASDCWAVGSYSGSNAEQTLVAHWNGTVWGIVPSPNTASTQSNSLFDVACTSPTDCWAVGDYLNGNAYQTLIERWNGTFWAIVGSPNASDSLSTLRGVTCTSASNCWAVGSYNSSSSNRDQTLIQHWDGSAWSITVSPNTDLLEDNRLFDITCTSGGADCWAVGTYFTGFTLTLRYNAPPAVLPISVVSHKTHGARGPFDVNLPLIDGPGIECRSGSTNGAHTVVFTFANTLTNVAGVSVTATQDGGGTQAVTATGSINPANTKEYIVQLSGAPNEQIVTISLADVSDSVGNNSASVSASMGVLLGDVNQSGAVDGNDVSAVQATTRQRALDTNFKADVNTSGLIDGNDVSLVQGKTRTRLP